MLKILAHVWLCFSISLCIAAGDWASAFMCGFSYAMVIA